MNCPNCGASVGPDVNRCLKCGSYVERPQPQPPFAQGPAAPAGPPPPPILPVTAVKSRQVAGILGILLGGLGVHRFYLGHITIGLAQLIMTVLLSWCTFGLTALAAIGWGIVEGIMILGGTINHDADGRPLKD